jgi:acyl-coenzyme A thioesterase PaaI-like protein
MAGLDQSILTGLARARLGGGSFPAQFSGLSYRAVGDGECTVQLSPAPQVLDQDETFATAAITMLCDYALSGAARSRVGRAATTPTVTLQIEYHRWPFPASDIVCRAVFRGWLGKLVIISGTLETATGVRLGSAYGRFLVQERTAATGFSRYPWETVSQPPLTLAQLTASERGARSFLLGRAASGPDDSHLSYERLYGIAEEPARPGSFRLRQPTGPHLANRSGLVHGGVTAGLLVDACLRAAATGPGSMVLSSSCTFLRAGQIDHGDLLASADVAFDGRQLSCVRGEVTDATGRCLMTGETLLAQPQDRSLTLALVDLIDELGDDGEQVADQAVVGDLEDGRLGVLVDRDDRLRGLHPGPVLDRAADPDREVQVRAPALLRRDPLGHLRQLRLIGGRERDRLSLSLGRAGRRLGRDRAGAQGEDGGALCGRWRGR